MKRLELHADEKRFFRLVKRAVGTNPFSDERASVDRQLLQDKSPPAGKRLLDEVIQAVELKLRKVCAGQLKPLQCFQDEDRELVQYGCLFHLFHKYCSQFDEHIVQQIDSGDTPCRVGFADRAIAEMVDYGIPRREARRYFALFFQMRRAFFFIGQIIGKSQCMKELRLSLWNNIFTHDIWLYDRFLWNRLEDFSTMLLGSTGTGKGLAASAIGRGGYIPFDERTGCFSESFTKVFIAVNLSQFAEQLVESELFGHKKGAFTGAVEKHTGTFSLCSKSGAIFLDEIGEVSIPIQIKLLQVLQDRFFTPVGSRRQERFHGRVIAATNQPIEKLRLKKVFRDDFYYRLCSDIIEVPSLAERIRQDPEELEILMVHMVKRITGEEAEELA